MCDTVFTLQSLLCAHFDQHVVSRRVSVFKCPDCSSHFGQKQLMLDHIKVGGAPFPNLAAFTSWLVIFNCTPRFYDPPPHPSGIKVPVLSPADMFMVL